MKLSRKTYVYIYIVTAAAVPLAYFILKNYADASFSLLTVVFWSMLAVITESLGVTLPSGIGISVSLAVILASIVVGGPAMGIIVSASGFLFRVLKSQDGKGYSHLFNTPAYKTIFNVAQSIIATGISGLAFIFLGGKPGNFKILPTLAIIVLYLLLNSALLSKLMAILYEKSFTSIWFTNVRGVLISTLSVGTLGIIIALADMSYGRGAVLLFFGPLLLARYTFKQYVEMRKTYIGTIEAFNRFMEAKDAYTGGHASRVETYAVELAKCLGLPESKINNIRNASILHDIGKIGVDDSILKKAGPLEDWEYEKIKAHPVIGSEIVDNVNFLKNISGIIRHHHERYDGKGYPDHLKGREISVESSILAIADVYDAMTSSRPYRKALSIEEAIAEIEANIGTQFNPEVAKAFLELVNKKLI